MPRQLQADECGASAQGFSVSTNAYRNPRDTRPGCTHQLACRCEPPFWLRPSTADEEAIAARIRVLSQTLPQLPAPEPTP
jgi:hypothetical protein